MTRVVAPEYLSADARVRLPTPDEALNIAYALHASSDPDLVGTPTQTLATDIVSHFLGLKPRRNNYAEEAYLEDAIKPIVHSYARALRQRKSRYRRGLEDAERVRTEKEARLNDGRFSKQGIGVIWRVVGPFILPVAFGIFGYLLAKLIGASDLVPDTVATTTGPSLPSIAMSLFFAWLGRILSVLLNNRARDLINQEYERRVKDADFAYELGKIEEFKLAHSKLCEAWRQYTGRAYRRTLNYQAIMEGDIALKQTHDASLRRYNKSLTDRIKDLYQDIRSALAKFRRSKPQEG